MSKNVAISDLGKGGSLPLAPNPMGSTLPPLRLLLALLLYVAVFVNGAILASAQEADDETITAAENSTPQSEEGLMDFVVTAGRTSEDSGKVAAQITVITARTIAESGATSVPQVLEQVAGVRFYGGLGGVGSESISMRGFGDNSFGRVLVLVDGNKLNNADMSNFNLNTIPIAEIERIEVLDGSASVLYGNYAVGGVINIITKKSGKEARTNIDISGGSFSFLGINFSHFRPTSWGNLSVSGGHSGSEGFRQNAESGTTNAALEGNIDLNDTMNLSLRSSFLHLNFQLPGSLTQEQYDDNPTNAQHSDDTDNKHFSDDGFEYVATGGINFLWTPNDVLEFETPLSYTWKNTLHNTNSYSYSASKKTADSVEFRPKTVANFNISNMPLRLLGGIDFYFLNMDNETFENLLQTGEAFKTKISEWTIGPYLNARFEPLSVLSINAGLRYDTAILNAHKDKKNTAPAEDETKTWNAFVYDAGLVVHPIEILRIYGKYSTLFRYPFTDEWTSWYGTTYDSVNTGLKPEKGFNVEGGLGVNVGKWGELKGNVYYMKLEDEIAYDSLASANVNMDTTTRVGSNISLTARAPYIAFQSAYSFVNAVFAAGDNDGKQIPLVPQHTIYASIMAELPAGISFGPDIEYQGERYFGNDFSNSQKKMEAYTVLGLKARYVLKKEGVQYALQLIMRNLTDKKYASYGYYVEPYPSYSPESYNYYPEDGRSFNISLQVQF